MPDVYLWTGHWVRATDLPTSKFRLEPKLKELFKTHDVYLRVESGGEVIGGLRLAKKPRHEIEGDKNFFYDVAADLYLKPLTARTEILRVAAFTPPAATVGRWTLRERLETLAGAMIAARRFLRADAFLAPEYYLSYLPDDRPSSHTGCGWTVRPFTENELDEIEAFLAEQSRTFREMLVVAGTVIRDPRKLTKELFNTALVYLDGKPITQPEGMRYDKATTGGFEALTLDEFNWGQGGRSDLRIELGRLTCALQICKDTMKPVTYPTALRLVVSMNLGVSDFGELPRDVPLVIADGGTRSCMVHNGMTTHGRPVHDLYVFNAPVKVLSL